MLGAFFWKLVTYLSDLRIICCKYKHAVVMSSKKEAILSETGPARPKW